MKNKSITVQLRIGELLEQQGRTAYWLAKHAGLNMGSAYKLRDGKADGIMLETIASVARALNVEPGDLFTWAPAPSEE